MRAFLRLLRKEIRELLRPRYLLPILLVPVVFVAMGQGFGSVEEQLDARPTVGVINADDGPYGEVVVESLESNAEVADAAEDGDPERALERVRAEGGTTLFVIPADFTERIEAGEPGGIRLYAAVESVSIVGIASSARTEALLQDAGRQVTLAVTGASPAALDPIEPTYTTYVKGRAIDASPAAISGSFTASFIFIPIVIAIVILFSGQMVMNAMAVEQENKTLETLLTMPVKRRTIVASKLVGGALIGLVATAIYTASFYYYGTSFGSGGLFGGGRIGPGFGPGEYALIGASIFFALVGALALTLCLGIFASDRQGAQMLLLPLAALVFLPTLATMFADVSTLSLPLQAVLYAIPFTHPVIAPKHLLFENVGVVLAGIAYEALFAAAMIGLAVWLFNSDRLVTGSTGRLGALLSFMQR
ncbi:MAG: ABC transporter permease [Halobacteriales archaeon]